MELPAEKARLAAPLFFAQVPTVLEQNGHLPLSVSARRRSLEKRWLGLSNPRLGLFSPRHGLSNPSILFLRRRNWAGFFLDAVFRCMEKSLSQRQVK